MGDFGPVFESLYTRLILRDLCGKVAPGALILVTGGTILTSKAEVLAAMNGAGLGTWLVFGAIAWLGGLAVQGMGELTSLIPYLPVRYFPTDVKETEFRKKIVDFDAEAVATPDDKQRHERLVVIMEAAGNGCLALFFSLVLVVIGRSGALHRLWPALILVLLTILGFGKLHYANVCRAYEHMEKVIDRQKKSVDPTTAEATPTASNNGLD